MEKYSKAVSEMYSQFKPREDHPLKKYIGRLADRCGEKLEVVGYNNSIPAAGPHADSRCFAKRRVVDYRPGRRDIQGVPLVLVCKY